MDTAQLFEMDSGQLCEMELFFEVDFGKLFEMALDSCLR